MYGSMNETDTRAKLIDPAMLAAGWTEDEIEREYRIRGQQLDYVLRVGGRIVAAVEAKRQGKPLGEAIEQARRYAELVNAYYAVATNGTTFVVVPMSTGRSEVRARFPGPDMLGTPRTADPQRVRDRICPQCGGRKLVPATGLDCRTCQGYGLVHSSGPPRPRPTRPSQPVATGNRYPPGWNVCAVCTPYTHTPKRHAQRLGVVNSWRSAAPPRPVAPKRGRLYWTGQYLLLALFVVVVLLVLAALSSAVPGA